MRLNKKTIIALVLCLGVAFMAVGYSILMTELNISGGANITSTWDIRITGITNGESVGSAYNIESPSFTETTAKFNVSLVNPGDSMTYEVTIENRGSITAILNNMSITTSGTDAIVYEVSGLTEGDTITSGATKTLTVVARYASGTTVSSDTNVKTLKVGLDWLQYVNQDIASSSYTINYDNNGGNGSIDNTTCRTGLSCSLSNGTELSRNGYVLLGWATTAEGSVAYETGEAVNDLVGAGSSITLYAVWGPISTFAYEGNYSTYTIATSGYYKLEVWGAQGGYRSDLSSYGGKGGYASGTVYLEKGTVLYIYVGGNGTTNKGYNGGGLSGCTTDNSCEVTIYGGGATDIRVNSTSLYARIIVAGGGGSVGASSKYGAAGGGLVGLSTTQSYYSTSYCGISNCGQGGTQTAGGTGSLSATMYTDIAGTFGYGGKGYSIGGGYGGAGGGGWYGGSGSISDDSGDDDRGGGGGSGYVLTSSSQKPSGYLLGSSYYMTNTVLLNGTQSMPNVLYGSSNMIGRSGDGYARITQLTVK